MLREIEVKEYKKGQDRLLTNTWNDVLISYDDKSRTSINMLLLRIIAIHPFFGADLDTLIL